MSNEPTIVEQAVKSLLGARWAYEGHEEQSFDEKAARAIVNSRLQDAFDEAVASSKNPPSPDEVIDQVCAKVLSSDEFVRPERTAEIA